MQSNFSLNHEWGKSPKWHVETHFFPGPSSDQAWRKNLTGKGTPSLAIGKKFNKVAFIELHGRLLSCSGVLKR